MTQLNRPSAIDLAEDFIKSDVVQPRRKGPPSLDPPTRFTIPRPSPRFPIKLVLGLAVPLLITGLVFGSLVVLQPPPVVFTTMGPSPSASLGLGGKASATAPPWTLGPKSPLPSSAPSAAPAATPGKTPDVTAVPTAQPTPKPTPKPTVRPTATPQAVLSFAVYPKKASGSCVDGLASFVLTLDNTASNMPVDWSIAFASSPYPGDWGTSSVGGGTLGSGDTTKILITPADICDYAKETETTEFTLSVHYGKAGVVNVTYHVGL